MAKTIKQALKAVNPPLRTYTNAKGDSVQSNAPYGPRGFKVKRRNATERREKASFDKKYYPGNK